ncbi:MAG: hypothetical protein U0805_20495 [Pirellulales bacterium]
MNAPLESRIQYVADERGKTIAVIVPIELWCEIESERETAYLLKSDAMRERLLLAKERSGGIPIDVACAKLGIQFDFTPDREA